MRHGVGPRDGDAELLRAQPHLAQVATFDMLEHAKGFARRVERRLQNAHDSRMLELRLDARLVEEARQKRTVLDVLAANHLEHTRPLGAVDGPRRRREEDLTHAAAGDALEQQVTVEVPGQDFFLIC